MDAVGWREGAIEQRGAQVDRKRRRLCKSRMNGKINFPFPWPSNTHGYTIFSFFWT